MPRVVTSKADRACAANRHSARPEITRLIDHQAPYAKLISIQYAASPLPSPRPESDQNQCNWPIVSVICKGTFEATGEKRGKWVSGSRVICIYLLFGACWADACPYIIEQLRSQLAVSVWIATIKSVPIIDPARKFNRSRPGGWQISLGSFKKESLFSSMDKTQGGGGNVQF